jgi:hypothetical protein
MTNTVVWSANVVELGRLLADCEPVDALPSGALFRARRLALGVPIHTLAAATSISPNSLRRYEADQVNEPRAIARSVPFRKACALLERLAK